jgi:hypothetical protein
MSKLLSKLNDAYDQLINIYGQNPPQFNEELDIIDTHISLIQNDMKKLILKLDKLSEQIITKKLSITPQQKNKMESLEKVNYLSKVFEPQILLLLMAIQCDDNSFENKEEMHISYIS